MAKLSASRQKHICPECGQSASVRRSKRRNLIESALHRLLFITPYRCDYCDARFFEHRLRHSPGSSPKPRAA